MAHGDLLKANEIFGEAPEELVVLADGAVLGHSDDDGKFCFQINLSRFRRNGAFTPAEINLKDDEWQEESLWRDRPRKSVG
jgi:hypothetical protein